MQVNALTTRLTVKTDTANSDSENVRYELMVDAYRTGETTAHADYQLNAKLTSGSDTHSKITATVYIGGESETITLKNSGKKWDSSDTHSFKGDLNITVKPKTTSISVALKATGKGSYNTTKTVSYTAYRSETYTYYEKEKVYGNCTYWADNRGLDSTKLWTCSYGGRCVLLNQLVQLAVYFADFGLKTGLLCLRASSFCTSSHSAGLMMAGWESST